jgi:hypothetical protein
LVIVGSHFRRSSAPKFCIASSRLRSASSWAFLRRQLPQLIVNQRQKLFDGVGIASLNGGQDLRNFTHRRRSGA